MIIDTHCHIDLYQNPSQIIKEFESMGMTAIGMTNLPSHFEMGYNHVLPFKKIRLALGMHPLYADRHFQEFNLFSKNISKTSYIGEVGLDFSREGISTKELQLKSFNYILNEIRGKKKILSIHSRNAEKEVLELLMENKVDCAIFHWYSGPLTLIEKIALNGYYFSVNPAMIKSKSGQEIISQIPKTKLLTESDGPFISVENRIVKPSDIKLVIFYLSNLWNISFDETENLIQNNFSDLISKIR